MTKEISDVRDMNGTPALLRRGMRVLLYQCTECGEIEESPESHRHRITSEGGHSYVAPHYPKRKVALLVERSTKDVIR